MLTIATIAETRPAISQQRLSASLWSIAKHLLCCRRLLDQCKVYAMCGFGWREIAHTTERIIGEPNQRASQFLLLTQSGHQVSQIGAIRQGLKDRRKAQRPLRDRARRDRRRSPACPPVRGLTPPGPSAGSTRRCVRHDGSHRAGETCSSASGRRFSAAARAP
jgi:hypothetical protein